MAEPIAFSYLNSTDGINKPVIGSFTQSQATPDYTVDGPIGGAKSSFCRPVPEATDAGLRFAMSIIDKGTLEFWFRPKVWAINGTSMTNPPTWGAPIRYCYNTNWSEQVGIPNHVKDFPIYSFYFRNSVGTLWEYYDAAKAAKGMTVTTSIVMAADTWHHFAFTWDRTANPTRIMYFDGNSVGTTNDSVQTNASPVTCNSTIGGIAYTPYAGYTTMCSDAYFALVKHFNYVKTDFSDRFNLRDGMNDQSLLL